MENGVEETEKNEATPLRTRIEWVEEWEDATQQARKESEKDRDYYDGIQWTAEEISQLEERGQPAITINRIFSKINTILGHEVRTRVDPRAYPRTPQHEDGAIAATDALRYVADRERFDSVRSDVAKGLFVEGYAGALVRVEQGKDGKFEVKLEVANWDRIFFDPHSRDPLFRDAKYVGVVLWMDLDDARAEYPDAVDVVDASVNHTGSSVDTTHDDRPRQWFDKKRNRIKVAELYCRKGDDWYVSHFTAAGDLIEERLTGYLDEDGNHECPLKLTSGFVTRENRRYGLVRMLRSPQDEINKRRSKLLHQLTMRQFSYTAGSVADVHETKLELARPDGAVEILDPNGFQILDNSSQVMGQLQLLQEAKMEIDAIGPNTAAMVAEGSTSGRHALAQQQAGSMELEPIFDHLRAWQMMIFRAMWARIRQFWQEETWIRVRDDDERKGFRFVALNRQMTRAMRAQDMIEKGVSVPQAMAQVGGTRALMQASQMAQAQAQMQGAQVPPEQLEQFALQLAMQDPEMQLPFDIENDVAALDVDIILDAAPETAVIEQEEFEQLANMAQGGLPIPPDIIIEASQLRNKRKLLEMLQQQNQPDPMAAQMAEMQAQLQQLQLAMAQAELEKTQAETIETQTNAEKNQAQAAKYAAEAGEKTASPPQPPLG